MPLTTATTVELFRTANGMEWRLAGTDSDGVRYFVPSHLDPATVHRTFWASETVLADGRGPLVPITA